MVAGARHSVRECNTYYGHILAKFTNLNAVPAALEHPQTHSRSLTFVANALLVWLQTVQLRFCEFGQSC